MAASTSAWVPAAHAVLTVWHGPCQPQRIDTVALGALGIIIGTRNGDTRRAPFSRPEEDLLLERGDAADAGGDEHAATQRVALDLAGLGERLGGGGQRHLRDAVGAARLLRVVEHRLGIEARRCDARPRAGRR